eukprot:13060495-Alexandrium_andersonii.AAC.1
MDSLIRHTMLEARAECLLTSHIVLVFAFSQEHILCRQHPCSGDDAELQRGLSHDSVPLGQASPH